MASLKLRLALKRNNTAIFIKLKKYKGLVSKVDKKS